VSAISTDGAPDPVEQCKRPHRRGPLDDRRPAFLIFLFFLCLYGLTSRGSVWSIDAAMRIGLAETLIEEGRVGYPPDCRRWLHARKDRLIWGLGHPLTLIPSALAGRGAEAAARARGLSSEGQYAARKLVREAAATATNALLGALTCTLLFLTGRVLGYRRRVAVLASLGLGLATTWWPYTQDGRYEILQGLAILGAFYGMIRHLKGDGYGWAAVSGGLAGYALITKLPNAGLVLPLALLFLLHSRRSEVPLHAGRSAISFLAPFLLFVGVQIWADWSWSGELFASQVDKDLDYQKAMAEGNVFTGVGALLFGPRHGLLTFAPTILLSILWLRGLERFRGLGWAVGLTFLAFALLGGKTYIIIGVAWGPRSLVALFPLVALCFLPWIEAAVRADSRALRALTIAVFSVSLTVQILGTTIQENRYQLTVGARETARFPDTSPVLHRVRELADVLSGETVPLAGNGADAERLPWTLSTLNYWWCLAAHEGIPRIWLFGGAALLSIGAAVCLRAILIGLSDPGRPDRPVAEP